MAVRSTAKTFFLVFGALWAAAAPLQAQGEAGDAPSPEMTAPDDDQLIRPGDVIALRIWREPDMSGEYVVDEAGFVVFPRLGEMRVLDDSPESLQAKLLAGFREYLRNPSIEIRVLRRVSVTGSVTNPGVFNVDRTVTVADLLAMAGGATPNGDQNEIRVIRDGQMLSSNIRQDQQLAESLVRSGDQIYIPERSWVSRNAGVVAAGITATVSLVIALFINN